MPKKTFGSRQRPPSQKQGGEDGADKYSKIDFIRGVLAATIQQFDQVSPAEKDNLAMRIRVLQDQLAELKRLSGARSHRSDDLAWVDIWRPYDPAE